MKKPTSATNLFTFFSFKSTSPSAARRKCPALTRQHAQGLLNTKHVEICRKCSQNCKEERKKVRKGQINVRRLVRELYRVFAIRMTKADHPQRSQPSRRFKPILPWKIGYTNNFCPKRKRARDPNTSVKNRYNVQTGGGHNPPTPSGNMSSSTRKDGLK